MQFQRNDEIDVKSQTIFTDPYRILSESNYAVKRDLRIYYLLLSLAALGAAFVALALPIQMTMKHQSSLKRSVKLSDKKQLKTGKQLSKIPKSADISFYQTAINPDLFRPPLPPAPPAPIIQQRKPLSVMPINPFEGWSYTGTVHIGAVTEALLENKKMNSGFYIQAGQDFMGAKVISVADHAVELSMGGKPTIIPRSEDIVITPFDKNAIPLGAPAQPTATSPATPATAPKTPPTGMPGGVPTMGAPGTIVLPNGRVIHIRGGRFHRGSFRPGQ